MSTFISRLEDAICVAPAISLVKFFLMINYIYLFLSSAFDVIDEADIKFHYHPGNESRHPPEVRRQALDKNKYI
jgi:hypothetical protein